MASATGSALTAQLTTERDSLRAAAKAGLQRMDSGQGNSIDVKAALERAAILTQVLAEITALAL